MKRVTAFRNLLAAAISAVAILSSCATIGERHAPAGAQVAAGKRAPAGKRAVVSDWTTGATLATKAVADATPTGFRITRAKGTDGIAFEYLDASAGWTAVAAWQIPKTAMDKGTGPNLSIISEANDRDYVFQELLVEGAAGVSPTLTYSAESDPVLIAPDEQNGVSKSAAVSYGTDSFTLTSSPPGDVDPANPGRGPNGWNYLVNADGDWEALDPESDWDVSWEIDAAEAGWAGVNLYFSGSEQPAINFVYEY